MNIRYKQPHGIGTNGYCNQQHDIVATREWWVYLRALCVNMITIYIVAHDTLITREWWGYVFACRCSVCAWYAEGVYIIVIATQESDGRSI